MSTTIPQTELDALEQLSNLLYTIEENNWEGIIKKVEHILPLTPRTTRQQNEIEKLKAELSVVRSLSKDTENKFQNLKIKLLAIKDLMKIVETLQDGNSSEQKAVS